MDATIIHLSDLHFSNDVENRNRIKYLLEDLNRIPKYGKIYSVLTGDLVQSGDDNTYEILYDELILPLIELGHEVATVPGNHDIQRSRTSSLFTDPHLKDDRGSYLFDGPNIVDSPFFSDLGDPLENYQLIEDLVGSYDRRTYWGYLRIAGPLSIVGLNSTWLSRIREEDETDRGKLRIEPHILDKLTEFLPNNTLKLALFHHPIDWLEENTRDDVYNMIIDRMDLALFGHVHSSDLHGMVRGNSDCLFVQSPPLRADWSNGTNGYGIIRCDTNHKKFEIDYRSYSKSRGVFVRGEDFAESGLRYPRPEDQAFFSANPSESKLLQNFIDGFPYNFVDWYQRNIRAKAKRIDSFVMPKARKLTKGADDSYINPIQRIDDIVSGSDRNQFFIAPLDAGSTTAAFLIFKKIAELFHVHKNIPAFIDVRDININKASITRAVGKSCLYHYSHSEIQKLLEEGHITIIVDGLCLVDIDSFNHFRDIANKFFKRVRFIFFLCTEKRGFLPLSSDSMNLLVEQDEVYEFTQLDVADIRSMVQLWQPDLGQERLDVRVAQVVESFKQMDEPIYASVVAVVVETLSQDWSFKPFNKSRLLERYVECLLGRFELEDVRVGVFASHDKINLLSFIARNMLESNHLDLDDGEWREICASYQEQYLIDLPNGLLEEFIEKGLLTLHRGRITFRADYLFSFFVARQMKSDSEFALEIIDGDGLFKYYREIVFYGELEGVDTRSVLDKIFIMIGEIEEVLLENYSREGIDLLSEWKASCDADAVGEESKVALKNAAGDLWETKPSPEHTDRVNDSQLSQVARRRGIARRDSVREAEAKLLVIMKLYSLIIKNALQIPAHDKLRHIQKLYDAAEIWVGFLCAKRTEISENPIVVTGGIIFINASAAIDKERSIRDFKFYAPNSLSHVLAESLRNPHLGVALRRAITQLSGMGSLFARDALLELPSADNRASYLESLVSESDTNLITSSLRSLRGRFLASGRNSEMRDHIEKILTALQSQRNPAVGIDYSQLRRAKMVQDLRNPRKNERAEIDPKDG